jgi:hypothetical protein
MARATCTYEHEDETLGLTVRFEIEAKVTKGDNGDYFTPPDPGQVDITSVILVTMSTNGIPIRLSDDARSEIQDAFCGMLEAKGKDADNLRKSVYDLLWKDEEDARAFAVEEAHNRREYPEPPDDDDCPW